MLKYTVETEIGDYQFCREHGFRTGVTTWEVQTKVRWNPCTTSVPSGGPEWPTILNWLTPSVAVSCDQWVNCSCRLTPIPPCLLILSTTMRNSGEWQELLWFVLLIKGELWLKAESTKVAFYGRSLRSRRIVCSGDRHSRGVQSSGQSGRTENWHLNVTPILIWRLVFKKTHHLASDQDTSNLLQRSIVNVILQN